MQKANTEVPSRTGPKAVSPHRAPPLGGVRKPVPARTVLHGALAVLLLCSRSTIQSTLPALYGW